MACFACCRPLPGCLLDVFPPTPALLTLLPFLTPPPLSRLFGTLLTPEGNEARRTANRQDAAEALKAE